MTTEATPAAADPATPAAAAPETPAAAAPETPPAAEAPVAERAESLLPPADKVEAEKEAPAEAKTVNQDEPEWFLHEGVRGEGKAPDWYKADKYKTVGEQAKAYAELEKRMGAFTGAPKDGKYDVKLPEQLDGSLDLDHPLLKSFTEWAREHQMNNESYNQVVGMLAAYEAELAPDPAQVKAALGDDADTRIRNVSAWAKANLALDEYELLRSATAGANAADVFKLTEKLIAKARQPRAAKPGQDVPAGQPTGEAAIKAAQGKIGPDGKRLVETDPQYRAMVDRMWQNFYASKAAA